MALSPTSQSASARHMAASLKWLYSLPSLRRENPSFMALSVAEEIQSLFKGFLHPAFIRIKRATSSPSRPASVAMTISFTSFLKSWRFTTPNCFAVFPITSSLNGSGIMGRSAIFQSLYFLSYSSGAASSTRWPNAQVTMYLSPSRQPSALFLQPSTLAISLPTEGFSAITRDFICSLLSHFLRDRYPFCLPLRKPVILPAEVPVSAPAGLSARPPPAPDSFLPRPP